jgi:predicted SAM-dependent methyltransferase
MLDSLEMIKLHLGCGSKQIPGFVNIDINWTPAVDQVCDISQLTIFEDASVDMIYACHVLEHFGRHEFTTVIKEWHRVLRVGGLLRLSVPDFAACARIYLDGGIDDIRYVTGLMVGGQRNEYDYHKMIFDEPSLTQHLANIGFGQVQRWDWRNTEHSQIDDYSQAYLPHMDREHGMLMSLNLECRRVW